MERKDTVVIILRTTRNIGSSGDTWPCLHLDVTWANHNHSLKHIWQNSTPLGGLKVPAENESIMNSVPGWF